MGKSEKIRTGGNMKNSKKFEEKNKFERALKDIKESLKPSKFDPNGSYTGLTKNGEKPVQDQDDL